MIAVAVAVAVGVVTVVHTPQSDASSVEQQQNASDTVRAATFVLVPLVVLGHVLQEILPRILIQGTILLIMVAGISAYITMLCMPTARWPKLTLAHDNLGDTDVIH